MRLGLTCLAVVVALGCEPGAAGPSLDLESEASSPLATPFSWSMAGALFVGTEASNADAQTLKANHFSYVGQMAMNRCKNNNAPYSCAANDCAYPGNPDQYGEVATWSQLQAFINGYHAQGLYAGLWGVPDLAPEAEAHCMAEIANTLRSAYGATADFFIVDAEKSYEANFGFSRRFVDVFDSTLQFQLAKAEAPECHIEIDFATWVSHGYTIQSQAYWSSYGVNPAYCLKWASDYGVPKAMNIVMLDGYAMSGSSAHPASAYADDIASFGSVGFNIWRTPASDQWSLWGPLIESRHIATWPGSAPPTPLPPRGYLDSVTCSAISGWAQDGNTPEAAISVKLYAGGPAGTGTLLGTFPANGYRPDLCTAIGSCWHGFSIPTPAALKDAQSHALYVYGVDSSGGADAQLGSTPKTLAACANNPPRGWLDAADCARIGGWAQDVDAPEQSIRVRIYRDGPLGTGTLLGTYPANQSRPDLCSYLGSCAHGFSVPTPAGLGDGASHAVYVYGVDSSGGPAGLIASSPKTVSGCVAHPPKGWLDVADCTRIAGWAYDPDAKDAPAQVRLYADGPPGTGTLLGTFAAADSRADLCTVLGSCAHGFSVPTPAALKTGAPRAVYAVALDTTGGASVALGAAPKSLNCP